jgi:hypothetical protein
MKVETCAMKRYSKLAAMCGMFVLAVSICASAGSSDNFSGPLTGVSNSTVTGSFSFNSATDQFTSVSLSFTSLILGDGKVGPLSINGTKGPNGQWSFQWWGFAKNGDLVIYDVTLNANGSFQVAASVADRQNYGGFNYMSVPEGGSRLAYLFMSAAAVFGAILFSGKNRRTAKSS